MPRPRVTAAILAARLARGQRILRAFTLAELSQAEAARRLRITAPVLNRVISGERQRDDLLPRIAGLCGVNLAWLRDGTGAAIPQRAGRSAVRDVGELPGEQPLLPRCAPQDFLRLLDDMREVIELPPSIARRLADTILQPAGGAPLWLADRRLFVVVTGPR